MSTPEGVEMGYVLDDQGNRTGEIVTRAEWDRRVEGVKELEGFVAALARDNIPTLAEVMAADRWVTLGTGGIVPVRLKRDRGWGDDVDRDSQAAQELARLVKDMDVMCAHVSAAQIPGAALKLANQWQAIRKITRDNGGK